MTPQPSTQPNYQNMQPLSHRHFACLRGINRKPIVMREKVCSMGVLSCLQKRTDKQSISLLSLTSDDLFHYDPLSLSPIKPSSQQYQTNESFLSTIDFDRSLKEILDNVKDFDETKRIIEYNAALDREIKELEEKSRKVLTKDEKKEIMSQYFGSELVDNLNLSENAISYDEHCERMRKEYLQKDITKFFLVDIDTLISNNPSKEDIKTLNEMKITDIQSMKYLLQKFAISYNFEGRVEQFQNSNLPQHIISSIALNMEKCFTFISSKIDDLKEEELLETSIFLIRTYFSIKVLAFKTEHNLNIVDPLSFGKILPLIHTSIERIEREFPNQQEKLITTISQIFHFDDFDTSSVSTIISSLLTPTFSQFISPMSWSHQSLIVNMFFKRLLLIILTRIINNPMSVSQIVNNSNDKLDPELILTSLKFNNSNDNLSNFEHVSDLGCYDFIYLMYNMYYLLTACFSHRNYNITYPLLCNNKQIAKECKSIFPKIASKMRRLSDLQYQALVAMRLDVFVSGLLPPNDNII